MPTKYMGVTMSEYEADTVLAILEAGRIEECLMLTPAEKKAVDRVLETMRTVIQATPCRFTI